ncbi:hypothetical protein MMC20_001214 [Loxospora ochrophaea]|nr:hypothetical protein [Loxospora ochrophaea]
MSTQGAFVTDSFSSPITAPHDTFDAQYDLSDPLEAINSYARTMHQHTKRQMDNVTRSSRRRSPDHNAVSAISTLNTEASVDSNSSTDNQST